jgi:hypothetical protein
MLYQAKAAIDTLFVRIGDGLAALTVLIGTRIVTLDMISFVWINVVLILAWIPLAVFLVRENRGGAYRRRSRSLGVLRRKDAYPSILVGCIGLRGVGRGGKR